MIGVSLEPFKETLWVATACGVVGILALKLPYRYNPFKLGRFLAPILGDDAAYRTPKWIGGLLLVCSLLLFGVIGLMVGWFSYQGMQHRKELSSMAETRARFDMAMIEHFKGCMKAADRVDLYRLKEGGYGFELVVKNLDAQLLQQVKGILDVGLKPRAQSHSGVELSDPDRSLFFNRDGKTLMKLSYHSTDGTFLCQSPDRPPYAGVMDVEIVKELNAWCAGFQIPAPGS